MGDVPRTRLGAALAAVGAAALSAALLAAPGATGTAAHQTWPPFVLVAGLLVIGFVAHREGVGSNLTNLLVLAGSRTSGQAFAGRMLPAWMAAIAVTGPFVVTGRT
jgi:hypothetical protein